MQIGETGPRAPVFTVVARPNGWQKNVRDKHGGSSTPAPITPVNALRQDLFAEVLAAVNAARPGIRVPARSNANWISFGSGPFGNWSLTLLPDGRVRVEAYLDCRDAALNKTLFDEMAADAHNWEERVGVGLSWERLDDRRASRIASYCAPVELTDPDARAQVRDWATGALIALHDALNTGLRDRAKQLRSSAISQAVDNTAAGVVADLGIISLAQNPQPHEAPDPPTSRTAGQC